MAIFYIQIRTVGRSQGKSGSKATSAAAYRSGERIRDDRTGRVYDHRRRADVTHKEIVLPAQLAAQGDSLAWARNRSTLWNAAEHAETRRNSRVAREIVVALPHELVPEKRAQLAMQFARAISDRYGSAVDVAIHAPRGDARNHHAHLLTTTREITPDGLGRKTTLELNGTQRHELGLPRWREEIASLREHWAALTNAALERANVPTRVTHLSRVARGLGPSEAPPRVPLAAYHMEQRGERSFIAEKIRARHRVELERAQSALGPRAPDRGESERRAQRIVSSARAWASIGRSVVRDIGAGARAAWRDLQGLLGGESREISALAAPVTKSTAVAIETSREGSEHPRRPTALGSEATDHLARLDEAALKSAQKWLASRGTLRAQDAELENPSREPVQELAADHAPQHSRGHGNDYGI